MFFALGGGVQITGQHRSPPKSFISRMTADMAGVDMTASFPTMTFLTPLPAANLIMVCDASLL